MSYSRWLESNWYVFPSTAGTVEAWRAGDTLLQWCTEQQTLEEFLAYAAVTITQDEQSEQDLLELRRILESNMEDIKAYCKMKQASK